MKITGINNKNIMFTQNQIYIYSDFDRTVSPNTTYDVLYAHDKNKIQKAKYNFDLINSLLNKYPKIKLFITTGRSVSEIKTMHELYQRQNVDFVNADSIIVNEGSDEFLKSDDVSSNYPYQKQNHVRKEQLYNKIGWDKDAIMKKLFNVLAYNNLQPLLCGTTLSAEKYGKYSAFSYPEQIHSNTVFIRDVGEYKLFLGFAKEIDNKKYDYVKRELLNYLDSVGLNYSILEKDADFKCADLRTLYIIPFVDGELLLKQYDIKEKLKEVDEDDTVIIAGDGINDYDMLNPETYKDKAKGEIISIVVRKDDEYEPELEAMVNNYQDTAQHKLIVINEGELADKVSEIAKQKYNY